MPFQESPIFGIIFLPSLIFAYFYFRSFFSVALDRSFLETKFSATTGSTTSTKVHFHQRSPLLLCHHQSTTLTRSDFRFSSTVLIVSTFRVSSTYFVSKKNSFIYFHFFRQQPSVNTSRRKQDTSPWNGSTTTTPPSSSFVPAVPTPFWASEVLFASSFFSRPVPTAT